MKLSRFCILALEKKSDLAPLLHKSRVWFPGSYLARISDEQERPNLASLLVLLHAYATALQPRVQGEAMGSPTGIWILYLHGLKARACSRHLIHRSNNPMAHVACARLNGYRSVKAHEGLLLYFSPNTNNLCILNFVLFSADDTCW